MILKAQFSSFSEHSLFKQEKQYANLNLEVFCLPNLLKINGCESKFLLRYEDASGESWDYRPHCNSGLDSQFAIVETILTGILDFAPQWRGKKTLIVGIVCIVGFLCGLPLTCEVSERTKIRREITVFSALQVLSSKLLDLQIICWQFTPMSSQGGGYVLDFLDYYAAGWPYLFIGLTELILVCYVYGIENFMDDLYSICNFNPGLWCKTIFMFVYLIISPLLISVRALRVTYLRKWGRIKYTSYFLRWY